MAASLDAGAINLTLEVGGYAYGDDVQGSDANWLRCMFVLRSDELMVRRSFLTLAPLQAWLDPLAGLISGTSPEAVIANTEEDFELAVGREGGDLRARLTVAVWNGLPGGRVVVNVPLTMAAVEAFHDALEEVGWVFPERGEQAER